MELLKEINQKEVLKYLGYRGGKLEDAYIRKIKDISKKVIEASEVKVCHVTLPIESHEPLIFENTDITLNGNDIVKHLETSSLCIFMAATLGNGVDKLIKKASATDMAEAVIIDACASSAIENVCDNYAKKLEIEYAKNAMYLTDRFSPGYGDMPLENQQDFCSITSCTKKIGLCCNRAMMLEPTKSVTALIGVSHIKQVKRKIGCEGCSLFFDCDFRKIGATCYEEVGR